MKGSTFLAVVILLVGLMVAPFFKDAIGGFMVYALVGGGIFLLIFFVVLGVVLIAFRDD